MAGQQAESKATGLAFVQEDVCPLIQEASSVHQQRVGLTSPHQSEMTENHD